MKLSFKEAYKYGMDNGKPREDLRVLKYAVEKLEDVTDLEEGFSNEILKFLTSEKIMDYAKTSRKNRAIASKYLRENRQEWLNNQLGESVSNNDLPKTRRLLELGADPNFYHEFEEYALQNAVFSENEDLVDILLQSENTDPNIAERDENGEIIEPTPLLDAVLKGNYSIFKKLLDRGGDMNVSLPDYNINLGDMRTLSQGQIVNWARNAWGDIYWDDPFEEKREERMKIWCEFQSPLIRAACLEEFTPQRLLS